MNKTQTQFDKDILFLYCSKMSSGLQNGHFVSSLFFKAYISILKTTPAVWREQNIIVHSSYAVILDFF